MAHKQEMNLPEWMPPLPEKRRRFFCTKCGSSECTPDTVKDKHPLCVCGYLGFGEDCDYNDDEMRDYGRQCVERDEQIERLRSQLPAEMQDCTIIFKECEKGHGRLTATNWVQHECQTCEIERFRSAYAGACVEMHGFLMDCGLTDCGFGTAKDWRDKAKAEIERLRARIDAVREIYAGMEGFIAQTAPEGYLQRIVKQMYDAALGGEGK